MSERQQNRELQLACIAVFLIAAVAAVVLMNQSDKFGHATHTGVASIAFGVAGVSLIGWFVLSLADWTKG